MANEPGERAPEAPTTTTTIIRERGSSGGATGIVMALILLVVVAGGIYLFSKGTQSETAKDEAITEAANNVGAAADKVGDAAQDAANGVHKDSAE
ncbi:MULTISPECIES: hypothetical protein [Novosphingobium]|uniref:Uncharacterized protein n=1 Tax=Novosphingobium pentaromativorans TaxID=205844 RepID=A0A2W5NNJ9_9SPHN|nr:MULTISPECIES: hypothetical protein [Novosphingobium]PZQ54068.1 MAG: hypothetical protein DI555_13390 [Novosphingobium pentaromativorans]GFE76457.1 hypothetical protein NTCA1_41060 [Novosphingobium sp. TCA1]